MAAPRHLWRTRRQQNIAAARAAVPPGAGREVPRWREVEYLQWCVEPSCFVNPTQRQNEWIEKMRDELATGPLKGDLPETIEFELSATKPPAVLTIDDRCVRFDGDWSAPELSRSAFFRYRPWMTRA